jgi:hypothetical protein
MFRYLLFNEDTNFLEKMSSFFFFIILLLIPLISSAAETDAVAAVSIYSDISYQSGRTCSTSCLWYRGPFRQYNHGHDLAIELSCGVAAVNGCYCKADFASSASSYISSCVSKGCSNLESVNEEIKTIMALYDGYCKTANVEVVTTTTSAELVVVATAESSAMMTSTSATGVLQNLLISSSPHPTTFSSWFTAAASPSKTSATEVPQNVLFSSSHPHPAGVSGSSTSTAASPSATSANTAGLGKSDHIALGVGLGVGVPSLLLALATLCVQLRKRKQRINKNSYVNTETNHSEMDHGTIRLRLI